jgi:hypothetical protein
MAFQLSTTVRNAMLDQMETTISTAPTLTIRTGAQPADCAAADSGTVLATIVLPSDWLAAASAGAKAIAGGPWQDASADNTGTAAHFRVKAGATCHMQGSVGTSATDMILDSVSFTAGQAFSITAFTITQSGA